MKMVLEGKATYMYLLNNTRKIVLWRVSPATRDKEVNRPVQREITHVRSVSEFLRTLDNRKGHLGWTEVMLGLLTSIWGKGNNASKVVSWICTATLCTTCWHGIKSVFFLSCLSVYLARHKHKFGLFWSRWTKNSNEE
jgi:hypothetical protein